MINTRLPNPEIVESVFSHLQGERLQGELIDLARINGVRLPPTPQLPERYATNRIALSEADQAGRAHVRERMVAAGMDTIDDNHPFALFGSLVGRNPSLPHIAVVSHLDTVKRGDMYDGTTGVLGSILVARAFKKVGFQPEGTIDFIACTGEESAAFGFVLFGSRSLTHGLTGQELNSTNDEGRSIRDVLASPEAITRVQRPYFGPAPDQHPFPRVLLELHVEQGPRLDESGYGLAVVNAIAAPMRHKLVIGNTPLEKDTASYPYAKYLELTIDGKADHSGATPMGDEYRADGLLETARIGSSLIERWPTDSGQLDIGDIRIQKQAINKIPGVTTTFLRLRGNTEAEIDKAHKLIEQHILEVNTHHSQFPTKFGSSPASLKEIAASSDIQFFEPEAMRERQKAAFEIITHTNSVGEVQADKDVVTTIGTYVIDNGKIEIRRDVRGIDKGSRDQAIIEMESYIDALRQNIAISSNDRLAGSTDPVAMDPELVSLAEKVIATYRVGSAVTMFSAAIHDTHNFAVRGIPSVMLFVHSQNGSHNPESYTSPGGLEVGMRGLAAMLMALTWRTT